MRKWLISLFRSSSSPAEGKTAPRGGTKAAASPAPDASPRATTEKRSPAPHKRINDTGTVDSQSIDLPKVSSDAALAVGVLWETSKYLMGNRPSTSDGSSSNDQEDPAVSTETKPSPPSQEAIDDAPSPPSSGTVTTHSDDSTRNTSSEHLPAHLPMHPSGVDSKIDDSQHAAIQYDDDPARAGADDLTSGQANIPDSNSQSEAMTHESTDTIIGKETSEGPSKNNAIVDEKGALSDQKIWSMLNDQQQQQRQQVPSESPRSSKDPIQGNNDMKTESNDNETGTRGAAFVVRREEFFHEEVVETVYSDGDDESENDSRMGSSTVEEETIVVDTKLNYQGVRGNAMEAEHSDDEETGMRDAVFVASKEDLFPEVEDTRPAGEDDSNNGSQACTSAAVAGPEDSIFGDRKPNGRAHQESFLELEKGIKEEQAGKQETHSDRTRKTVQNDFALHLSAGIILALLTAAGAVVVIVVWLTGR